jgi:hypothetical protein
MRILTVTTALLLSLTAAARAAEIPREFKIARQAVFEFTKKPVVTRDGDKVRITFTSKGYCDVTVAVEDAEGKIIRHLVSGVLGKNAPPPFKKNSLEQVVVWDGKNDQGVYIDDKDVLRIRVSLGLKPQFERSMFWEPKRRPAEAPPLAVAAKEGLYVFNGGTSIDSVILYDHNGDYGRTVYPFPSNKIEQTQGLQWRVWPQDNQRLAMKTNFMRCTMLTSGNNAGTSYTDHRKRNWNSPLASLQAHFSMFGRAARALSLRGNRLALAYQYVNRLGVDGTTAGLPLLGSKLMLPQPTRRGKPQMVSPYSVALSPDGKTLYVTGYHFGRIQTASQDIAKLADLRTIPVVMRLDYEKNDAPTIFKGALKLSDAGADNEHFKVPSSVAVDAKGRVYVGDYMNDRVQIYDPSGKHLKTIKAYRPAQVAIHEKTGDIYVFSWTVRNQYKNSGARSMLAHYGPFEKPAKIAAYPLGVGGGGRKDGWGSMSPVALVAGIDSWTDPLRVWIAEPWRAQTVLSKGRRGGSGLQILEIKDGALKKVRDFAADCAKARVPVRAAVYYRQRLYVNPANGRVYVSEGSGSAIGKSFHKLFELDPETGRHRTVLLPFDAEDMCFDLEGLAYLRSVNVVVRYNSRTWREVPWDYGEERKRVAFGWMSGTKTTRAVSGILMPSDGNWHHGGMHVSADRKLIVACGYNVSMKVKTTAKYVHDEKKYLPTVFPGRLMGGRAGMTCVHVWDQRGKLIKEDIIPGLTDLYGVGIDTRNDVYLMSSAPRMIPGKTPKRYPDRTSGTIMKFPKGEGRVLTVSKGPPVKLPESQYLDRPYDTSGGNQGLAWLVGAEWAYGGVGFSGGNIGGCSCWNARFALDYFSRSFAPEVTRYSVAVLDSAGNVILRIGRYGNVDDGVPLIKKGGPSKPRSVGGDEVALFHAPYLATHSDRRLFIADGGNGRVLSIKLNYHANETVALKDVPDKDANR